jgi:low affinity Fe/Cu permease
MSFYALILPVSIVFCLFALVCLFLSIRGLVLRFEERGKVSLLEAVAIIGTLTIFVIFANFSYRGYTYLNQKVDKSPEFYFLDYGNKK